MNPMALILGGLAAVIAGVLISKPKATPAEPAPADNASRAAEQLANIENNMSALLAAADGKPTNGSGADIAPAPPPAPAAEESTGDATDSSH